MEEIKITIEKNGELSVLHLKTDKSLFDIINAIGNITKQEDVASFIEKQLLSELFIHSLRFLYFGLIYDILTFTTFVVSITYLYSD
jgi:hypothetical protein